MKFYSSHSFNKLFVTETPKESNSATVMHTRDWRSALRSPPTYRLGNRTFRFNYHFTLIILAVLAITLVLIYVKQCSTSSYDDNGAVLVLSDNSYNSTYPLTLPVIMRGTQTYRIGMVADLDTASRSGATWKSYIKKGYLKYVPGTKEVKITWDEGEPTLLESAFALKGRGMELSELVTFNGKLLTFDDRTGLIYELRHEKPVPWVILLDGNGHLTKGFKAEWATVKDQMLYVGSMGKEWTTSQGEFENENPMFVKVISPGGEVRSVDWSFNYKTLRSESMNILWPGYMIHESGVWSHVHKKWFFLPRRCSKEKYNETRDEHMGCNLLITADEKFSKIQTVTLENPEVTHGFSSFKFIPGCGDNIILAIKSQELAGKTSTFCTVFNIDGKIILPEERIPTDFKYEGIEFI